MKTQIRNLLRAAEYVLVFIGVWALGYWSCVLLSTKVYQVIEGREFSRALQAKAPRDAYILAVPPAAKPRPKERAGAAVIGRLTIPRVGLSTIVVEGVGDRDLRFAAGHIPGTSLPGQRGNVGMAGHRDTFFRPLHRIRKNDAITVTTLNGEFGYRVVSTEIVGPEDVQVLYSTKNETLTLITCYPFNFVGPAPKRFIVRAERL